MSLFVVLGFLLVYIVQKLFFQKQIPPNLKEIPWAHGWVPFFGHFLKTRKNFTPFLQECHKKYGKIFKLQIFTVTWVAVCDREFCAEFYNTKETQLSFIEIFKQFWLPFFDVDIKKETVDNFKLKNYFSGIRNMMKDVRKRSDGSEKKAISTILAERSGQILLELEPFFNGLVGFDLSGVTKRYILSTLWKICFGVELDLETLKQLEKGLPNFIWMFIAFPILPHWMRTFLLNKSIQSHFDKLTSKLSQEIEEYKRDRKKTTSLFIRQLVDAEDPDTGRLMSNNEIVRMIYLVSFAAVDSATSLTIQGLLDLLSNPEIMEQLKSEVAPIVETKNWEALLDHPLLHKCIMETARLNGSPSSNTRKPIGTNSFGGYYVGDVDFISLCQPVMHEYNPCRDNCLPRGGEYDPHKFQDAPRNKGYPILAWGAGVHQCPGEHFGKDQVKIALAVLVTKLNFDLKRTTIGEVNFGPSDISERKNTIFLKKQDDG